MALRKRIPAIALAVGVGSGAAPARAIDWSDNTLQYLYGTRFHDSNIPFNRSLPGVNITKNILNFSHVDTYKYGGNQFSADLRKSDGNDPANNSTAGAQEAYVVFRTDLSFTKVSGKDWKWGFVRDVALTAGFDWNTKDTAFAPRLWRPKIGPKVEFDVPNGKWNLAFVLQHETNHCGTCNPALGQRTDVNFGYYWGLETAWNLKLGSTNWNFSGNASYYGSKKNNGNGSPTAPETYLRARVMYDIGAQLAGVKNTVLIGAGYQYRHNQFGNSVTPVGYPFGGPGLSVPGRNESVPMFVAEWHF